MREFVALRTKTYAYIMDDDSLFNDKIILRSQQRFRSNHHKVYTEEVNKIVVSSKDDKRIQTFDKITTYPHGAPVIKVCGNKMLSKKGDIPIKLYY